MWVSYISSVQGKLITTYAEHGGAPAASSTTTTTIKKHDVLDQILLYPRHCLLAISGTGDSFLASAVSSVHSLKSSFHRVGV